VDRERGARVKYELVFWGGSLQAMPPHERYHADFAAAEAEAHRVLALLENREAHPAIIYGPGCGRDGVTIR
jgi:hypothetical protein